MREEGRLLELRKLSDVNLRKLFPSHVYRRGLEYYQKNKVNDLLYDINNNVWTATVNGSEDYFVEINMDEIDKGVVNTYCDCPAFYTFGTCKHIAATLIGITDKESKGLNEPSVFHYQITDRFMQSLRAIGEQNREVTVHQGKIPMQIEFLCKWSYDKNLLIELKAGASHRYVVKDVFDFIENVLQGNEHFFTKKFTYSPMEHYLLKQDLDIFEMLYSIKKSENIYNGYTFYHYRGNINDKRSIVVPPLIAKELLEKLIHRDFTVEWDGENYSNLTIEQDTLPFQFDLTKNEKGDLLLNMENNNGGHAEYFKNYEILFSNGTFYYPKKEQIPILEQIVGFGMDELSLPITKKQADVFVSEVIPSLKKVGEVKTSKAVQEEIIQYPLQAKLYLEQREDLIIGKLEYYYGHHFIDPFNGGNNEDVIIIRDMDKEQKIM